ncbi:MAG: hypothetical protein IKE90_02230 [Bacilli bacterium]|nr:hypothetical protein [Bacilli bacterium]
MKKKIILFAFTVMVFTIVATTFAIYRGDGSATGTIDAATWSISRSQSASGDSLSVIPELASDVYNLTVTSNSEVDVVYTIIVSNLPTGVEVSLDNGTYQTPTSGTVRISNAQTVINYNDTVKTKNHTLTFRATSSAQVVSDQEIDIDVEFRQTL